MGLFDWLRGAATASAPVPVHTAGEKDVLYAPVDGRLVELADVPDPVFAKGVMGPGFGVWPSTDVVYAPVSGTVSVVMGHAVGITSDDGAEALVHVGVDTVEMKGGGFEALVRKGERVLAGQPCLRIDREKIAAAGHPDCVICAVTNGSDFAGTELVGSIGVQVSAGAPVLRVRR